MFDTTIDIVLFTSEEVDSFYCKSILYSTFSKNIDEREKMARKLQLIILIRYQFIANENYKKYNVCYITIKMY